MSVPTPSCVGRAVRLGILIVPGLGAAVPAEAAGPTFLYQRTSQQIRVAATQLCDVAAPYNQAPGWSVLHGHAVEIVACLDQLGQALAYGDLNTARAIADKLEELGECAEDVADDLDDWICPRTPAPLYRARVRAAEDLSDFIESRTDRLRRVVRTFRPAFGGGCPLTGGGVGIGIGGGIGIDGGPFAPAPLPRAVTPTQPLRPLPSVPNPGLRGPVLPQQQQLAPTLPAPTRFGPGADRFRNDILAARFGNRGGRFGSGPIRTRNGYRFGF